MKRMVIVLLLAALCGCAVREEPLAASAEQTVEPEQVQGYVALTFDDGPSASYTPLLLDGLKERGARATFFVLGCQLEGNEELVRRMKAEGHQIGNHSYDHAQLSQVTTAEAVEDLVRCDLALCSLLGEGDYWVRPPYGSLTGEEQAAVGQPVVCWSVDPRDWECLDVGQILDVILREAEDGDIILMHDCYATTVEAALRAVDHLQARGLQVVTVAELMDIKGVEPTSGTIYYSVT